MATTAIENYLKQILLLEEETTDGSLISMGLLAETMKVVPGTATAMVKRLADTGLLIYEPYGGVRLSKPGRTQALSILRRHRLIETFLVQALGLDWSEVHQEAEDLEHALSDLVLDRIDAFLHYPTADPHGDPIPAIDVSVSGVGRKSILDCSPGDRVRISRILDQNQDFLQFIDRCGLKPGAEVLVQSVDPAADTFLLSVPGCDTPTTMGRIAARKLMVEPTV